MDITDIELFLNVCNYESITAAASAYGISQQSLSYRINQFEKELGQSLFFRSKSGVQLTAFGLYCKKEFKPLLDLYIETKQKVLLKSDGNDKIVSFAAVPFFFRIIGMDALSFFNSSSSFQPKYIELDESLLIQNLKSRRIRFAFTADRIDAEDQRLCSFELGVFPRYVVLNKNHPLADKEAIDYSELKNSTFLGLKQQKAFRQRIMKRSRECDFVPKYLTFSADPDFLFYGVDKGQGICFSSTDQYDATRYKNMRILPLNDDYLAFRPEVIFLKDFDLQKQDYLFINHVSEYARKHLRLITTRQ